MTFNLKRSVLSAPILSTLMMGAWPVIWGLVGLITHGAVGSQAQDRQLFAIIWTFFFIAPWIAAVVFSSAFRRKAPFVLLLWMVWLYWMVIMNAGAMSAFYFRIYFDLEDPYSMPRPPGY